MEDQFYKFAEVEKPHFLMVPKVKKKQKLKIEKKKKKDKKIPLCQIQHGEFIVSFD